MEIFWKFLRFDSSGNGNSNGFQADPDFGTMNFMCPVPRQVPSPIDTVLTRADFLQNNFNNLSGLDSLGDVGFSDRENGKKTLKNR